MNIATPPKFGSKNTKTSGMGASVLRKEDAAFITGKGQYTDDLTRQGVLHGYLLRSPYAHASFKIEDTKAAMAIAGVHLILTAKDITEFGNIPCQMLLTQEDGTKMSSFDIPLLCRDTTKHLGDGVAFIVADTLAAAREAAEAIEVDYDMLEVCADTQTALYKGAPLVHAEHGSNKAFQVIYGDEKKVQDVFAKAAKVSELRLLNNRLVCNYMEPRAALGEWNAKENRYTLTTGTQGVHGMQNALSQFILKVPKDQIRVITPDVGGGFGPKVFPYREYPLTLIAAKKLGRPVKWTCDRSEHFLSDAQGRDNIVTMRMAMDKDGRFLAMDVDLIAAMGAYLSTYGPFVPTLGQTILTGIYDIPDAFTRLRGVYTHTVPVDAYRGAGRPEAIYALERLVDQCARDLDISVDEIRRRNAIKPSQMPYTTATGSMYDTGEFVEHMELSMQRADWANFEKRVAKARKNGKIRGIGMSTYIEACAFAGSEPAFIELGKDGRATVLIGTQSNGQGHATAYTQLAAEVLGMDINDIDFHQGDTDRLESGGGTGGSRSIPLGGVSVHRASGDLAEKIKKIAADKLEAATGDLELVEGTVRIVGTDRSMTFAEVAAAAANEADLKGEGEFKQEEATYPNGTHICEVEIDPATGVTEIIAYTIVDDFGVTLNPILLQGQVHGGVAQAIGQCITEHTVYDEEGQLLTASFMDYGMPRADDIPNFSFETRNVPSTTNAMGMKGAGEAGTIGGCPAVINAIVDALYREYGIENVDMPATPAILWNLMNEAAKS